MKEDPHRKFQEAPEESHEDFDSEKKGLLNQGRFPFAIGAVLLAVILVGIGVFFFVSGGGQTREEAKMVQSRMMALEQKMGVLEKQLEELAAKVASSGPEGEIGQRLRDLSLKVDALEKRSLSAQPKSKATTLSKTSTSTPAKPETSAKPMASNQKKYHTVQKGDTLYSLSRKYKISMKELARLNHLTEKQPLHPGQKLIISAGR